MFEFLIGTADANVIACMKSKADKPPSMATCGGVVVPLTALFVHRTDTAGFWLLMGNSFFRSLLATAALTGALEGSILATQRRRCWASGTAGAATQGRSPFQQSPVLTL